MSKTFARWTTEPGEHGFVTLDICHDCKGAWFDKDELDRLDDSVWVDAEQEIEMREAESGHAGLDCPSCDAKLEAISPIDAPELIIDRCRTCGGGDWMTVSWRRCGTSST